jgi:RES domain-containing protein
MELWRISNHIALDGEGGRRAPARWHSAGSPVVYLAASPPGALIEVLVHLEIEDATVPLTYALLRIEVPSRLRIPALSPPDGESWKQDETITRRLGDAWLTSGRSALARVPSAIIPETYNYLLNPLHKDAPRIRIVESLRAVHDPRLLKLPRLAPR